MNYYMLLDRELVKDTGGVFFTNTGQRNVEIIICWWLGCSLIYYNTIAECFYNIDFNLFNENAQLIMYYIQNWCHHESS